VANHRGIQKMDRLGARIRWLALATGCFSAGASLALGLPFLVESAFLVLGALVQRRSPLPGRWLIWVSAFSMSVKACQFGVATLPEIVKAGVVSVPVLAILLELAVLVGCDVALVMDAANPAGRDSASGQPPPGSLDWVVWIAAVALSAYYLSMSVLAVRPYRLYGRLDILVTAVALTSAVFLFGVALVVHARRSRVTP
jgi:hypothetical protein